MLEEEKELSGAGDCVVCGGAGAARSTCPACLLRLAMGAGEPPVKPQSIEGAQYFGDYELLRELGRGGMGLVYEARQFGTQRPVALKFLLAGALATREAVHRFQIEAKAAALLDHPNIVPIYEVGLHDGQYFLAMRYLPGGTLAALAAREGLSAKGSAELIRQIALAIHYAHTRGVLHRDLNPRNILLTESGTPAVCDFGLAQIACVDERITLTNSLLGTAAYMAPEQAAGGTITTLTDVYALGAIFYELLAGSPPFRHPGMAATLRAIVEDAPLALSTTNPGIARDLETICLKCLEKNPAQRYASAQELADDLARFLNDEAIAARPSSAASHFWRWCRRNPALATACSVLAATFGLIAVLSPLALYRIDRERQRAEQNLYVSTIQLATRELHEHRPLYARRLLQNIAGSREPATRDWEWRYLAGRAQPQHSAILSHHKSYVAAIASSPDGQWAAALDGSGLVKLWKLPAAEPRREWIAHGSPDKERPNFSGMAAAFSPDSRYLATGGRDGVVRLWPIPALADKKELERLDATCTHLAFSADGQLLAALSMDGEITLWSCGAETVKLLHRWKADGMLFQDLALSADRKTLAIAGFAQAARFWDISTPAAPQPIKTWEGTAWPLAAAFDRFAAGASSGRQMLLVEVGSAKLEGRKLPGLSSVCVSATFSSDGEKLALGLVGGEIVVQDLTGAHEPITLTGHEDYVTGLAFAPDGATLLSGSRDKTVRAWTLRDAEPGIFTLQHGYYALAVRFSPDSRHLASVSKESAQSGSRFHSVKLWDLNTLKEVASARMQGEALSSHPTFLGEDSLAVDDWGKRTEIFDVPSLQRRAEIAGHAPVAASPHRLVYASGRRIISRALLPKASLPEETLVELDSPVWTLALSPDQSLLAFTTAEGDGCAIHLLDTASGQILGTASGHDNRIYAATFSPDGKRLATAALDSKVCLWDAKTRVLAATLRGHTGDLTSLCFTPDGRRLASGGEDGAIRLWDTASQVEVARIDVPSYLCSLDFSPDGQWLAAAGGNGSIYLWHAPPLAELNNSIR